MEMKANGGMFKYRLITEVADILLDFLENIIPMILCEAYGFVEGK